MIKKITLTITIFANSLGAFAQVNQNIDDVLRYGNYDTAIEYFRNQVKVNKIDGEAYYNLGRLHLAQQRLDSAEYYFNAGLKAKKNPEWNNLGLAKLSLEKGKNKEAFSKINALNSKDKKYLNALTSQGAVVFTTSKNPDFAKAKELLKKAMVKNEDDINLKLIEGDIFYAEGARKSAELKFKEIIKLDPKNIEARLKLAKLYEDENSYAKAIELYKQANEINAEMPAIYRDMAFAYRDYAEFSDNKAYNKDAVDNFAKFRTCFPNSIDIDNQYANFLISVEDYDALTRFVEEKWPTRGDNFNIYRYAAVSTYENDDADNAYLYGNKYFDVQDKKDQLSAVDYFYLGLAQISKSVSTKVVDEREFATGISNLEKGIALDPKLANRIYTKARPLFDRELYKQAYFMFDLGTKNDKIRDYVSNNYYKGASLYMTQDQNFVADPLSKAIQAFDTAIAVSPVTYEAYLMNARANRNLNTPASRTQMIKNYEGFLNALQQKNMMYEDALQPAILEANMYLGEYYTKTDRNKAISHFQKALQIDPNHQYSRKSLQALYN